MRGKAAAGLAALLTCAPVWAHAGHDRAAAAVWSADFDNDASDRLAQIKARVEDFPDHRARGAVSLDGDCAEAGADGPNACALVTLQRPDYDAAGEIITKYNVNGEVDLDGYRGTVATLTYRFHMAEGADLRKQGKLPGLTGARGAFGGDAPIPAVPDSWSTRLMWLDTGPDKGHPVPSLYIYDQYRAQTRTGEHNRGPIKLVPGQWHEVAMFVSLNDPGEANGRAELWLDGQLAACRVGLTFRNTGAEATMIQQLAFHNYYGGSARNPEEWPQQPVEMRFDDFAVFDGRNTPFEPAETKCDGSYEPNYLVPKPD